MFVQVQLCLDESNVFKLVVRTESKGEGGVRLMHQEVVTLDESIQTSVQHLVEPILFEFKNVDAVASAEAVQRAREYDAKLEEAEKRLEHKGEGGAILQ